ncbi:methyltransferase domain-containing protein [Hymenobacter cellulosilyticus]|uniref:Methyltransferase domain-containing protein n=1 Tax=Hymenobacter cellulosilyticus TaxID=2932248 RepID=A0A8T9Q8T4_9BACT|nr:methyltransferase domain-containing protein [Hymenobacter cellulosilyticus]UOQ72821.1 methyltransferase domain-containing protein [Hymenobacter cellulosilyticus]
MPDLSTRATEEELMDDLSLASDALRQNLDELETINTWLGGYRVVLDGLQRLRSQFPTGRALRLADLGSGGGDTLRHIAGWARRQSVPVELVGIDANAFMIDYAAAKAASFPEISFQQQDIFGAEFRQQQFDIITCSLFCHHFSSEALAELLRQLKTQARVGVLINDLHRQPVAYYSIKWLTRLFRGSYLVQNDAPLSVARAFARRDWQQILAAAGIERYTLRWCWAFRWQVIF